MRKLLIIMGMVFSFSLACKDRSDIAESEPSSRIWCTMSCLQKRSKDACAVSIDRTCRCKWNAVASECRGIYSGE